MSGLCDLLLAANHHLGLAEQRGIRSRRRLMLWAQSHLADYEMLKSHPELRERLVADGNWRRCP